ncbi:MAG TPA: hypothetical protein ENN30_01850 [Candidatus Woesearchaeota archaeon]|nr:hypothetical protein [Candidatus Woesearchaeota archaeon]
MYYDFWVEEIDLKLMEKLGFQASCYVSEFRDWGSYSDAKKENDLAGVVIKAGNMKEFRTKIREFRNADFIVLDSRSEKTTEMAVKLNAVDAVTFHARYPTIKKMAEKGIAQIINFNDLLNAGDKAVENNLKLMQRSVKLARKYGAPLMVVSGAKEKMECRAASDLIGFGELLGLTAKQAKDALTVHQEALIKRTKLKDEGKWVRPGVELEDDTSGSFSGGLV